MFDGHAFVILNNPTGGGYILMDSLHSLSPLSNKGNKGFYWHCKDFETLEYALLHYALCRVGVRGDDSSPRFNQQMSEFKYNHADTINDSRAFDAYVFSCPTSDGISSAQEFEQSIEQSIQDIYAKRLDTIHQKKQSMNIINKMKILCQQSGKNVTISPSVLKRCVGEDKAVMIMSGGLKDYEIHQKSNVTSIQDDNCFIMTRDDIDNLEMVHTKLRSDIAKLRSRLPNSYSEPESLMSDDQINDMIRVTDIQPSRYASHVPNPNRLVSESSDGQSSSKDDSASSDDEEEVYDELTRVGRDNGNEDPIPSGYTSPELSCVRAALELVCATRDVSFGYGEYSAKAGTSFLQGDDHIDLLKACCKDSMELYKTLVVDGVVEDAGFQEFLEVFYEDGDMTDEAFTLFSNGQDVSAGRFLTGFAYLMNVTVKCFEELHDAKVVASPPDASGTILVCRERNHYHLLHHSDYINPDTYAWPASALPFTHQDEDIERLHSLFAGISNEIDTRSHSTGLTPSFPKHTLQQKDILKRLAGRAAPTFIKHKTKEGYHENLSDTPESLEELKVGVVKDFQDAKDRGHDCGMDIEASVYYKALCIQVKDYKKRGAEILADKSGQYSAKDISQVKAVLERIKDMDDDDYYTLGYVGETHSQTASKRWEANDPRLVCVLFGPPTIEIKIAHATNIDDSEPIEAFVATLIQQSTLETLREAAAPGEEVSYHFMTSDGTSGNEIPTGPRFWDVYFKKQPVSIHIPLQLFQHLQSQKN